MCALHSSEMAYVRTSYGLTHAVSGGLDALEHSYTWHYTQLQLSREASFVAGTVAYGTFTLREVASGTSPGWTRDYRMGSARIAAAATAGHTLLATASGSFTSVFPWQADNFTGIFALADVEASAAAIVGRSVRLSSVLVFYGNGEFPPISTEAGGLEEIYGLSAGIELGVTCGYLSASNAQVEQHVQQMSGVAVSADDGFQASGAVAHFDPDEYSLNEPGRQSIRHFCAINRATLERSDTRLRIHGYTDTTSTAEHNQQLSQLRADEVRRMVLSIVTWTPRPADQNIQAIAHGQGPAQAAGSSGRDAEWRRVDLELNGRVVFRLQG